MTLRILGIDPGLRVTGYGAIECNDGAVSLLEAGIVAPDVQAS
ncbi:MAG: crossover junction endodeoxyribonuclease RuvC [Candidatus Eremiobacteraeota bacterium]|nr:crossover junction endodeoxyribonuclease RuvC [Candidatus Eremiobacteraeota bacterium]